MGDSAALNPSATAADRCPYHRRFREGFRECAAFVGTSYQTVDFARRPTHPILTCAHLGIGAGDRSNHFYPRCALGSAEDRERWVEGVTPELLARLREVSAAYRSWATNRMRPLWDLKARYIASLADRDSVAAEAARRELEIAVEALTADAHAFNSQHAPELREVGLSIDAVDAMVRLASKHWAFKDLSDRPGALPDELLEQFPPRLRLYLTAGRESPPP